TPNSQGVSSWIFLCEPSQNGRLAVCLQRRSQSFCASDTLKRIGEKAEPLYEPSQKDWRFDWPQAHHQYSSGASSTANGDFCAMSGSAMSPYTDAPSKNRVPGSSRSSCAGPRTFGLIFLLSVRRWLPACARPGGGPPRVAHSPPH